MLIDYNVEQSMSKSINYLKISFYKWEQITNTSKINELEIKDLFSKLKYLTQIYITQNLNVADNEVIFFLYLTSLRC